MARYAGPFTFVRINQNICYSTTSPLPPSTISSSKYYDAHQHHSLVPEHAPPTPEATPEDSEIYRTRPRRIFPVHRMADGLSDSEPFDPDWWAGITPDLTATDGGHSEPIDPESWAGITPDLTAPDGGLGPTRPRLIFPIHRSEDDRPSSPGQLPWELQVMRKRPPIQPLASANVQSSQDRLSQEFADIKHRAKARYEDIIHWQEAMMHAGWATIVFK